jgi:glyoxylase I family protein
MVISQFHVGITVSDLSKSIAFYRDIMGFNVSRIEPPHATRGRKLGVPGAIVEIAILHYGEKNDSIELIKYITPPPPNEYGAPVNALGQAHICFRVDNIDKEMERLKQCGVSFVGGDDYEENTYGPLKGLKWVYLKDPDGTNLEIQDGDFED